MSITLHTAQRLTEKPSYTKKIINKKGLTQDIIDAIINSHNTHKNQLFKIAKYFRRETEKETARAIWKFIKQNFTYARDEAGKQLIAAPAYILYEALGDCKSYSLFAASILHCLKIPFAFRFTSYDKEQLYTHVYICSKNFILDSVLEQFNKEKEYKYKKDINMYTEISSISGFPYYESLYNNFEEIGTTGKTGFDIKNVSETLTQAGGMLSVLGTAYGAVEALFKDPRDIDYTYEMAALQLDEVWRRYYPADIWEYGPQAAGTVKTQIDRALEHARQYGGGSTYSDFIERGIIEQEQARPGAWAFIFRKKGQFEPDKNRYLQIMEGFKPSGKYFSKWTHNYWSKYGQAQVEKYGFEWLTAHLKSIDLSPFFQDTPLPQQIQEETLQSRIDPNRDKPEKPEGKNNTYLLLGAAAAAAGLYFVSQQPKKKK